MTNRVWARVRRQALARGVLLRLVWAMVWGMCWSVTPEAYGAGVAQDVSGSVGTGSQVARSQLTGTVLDPSGAEIPGAAVHLKLHGTAGGPAATTGNGTAREATTDATGHFSVDLASGEYELIIDATGFDSFVRVLTVTGRTMRFDAKLTIATESAAIDVASDGNASTAAADNKNALVFKGDQLDTFSNNDSSFQQQILSMAGGSGEGGGSIYVDGFSGGRFPPKDTIREIRINQNPFSPQFEDLGLGRVEISTKPGTGKVSGSFFTSGNDDVLNARNPYIAQQLPYYSIYSRGTLSGPLGRKMSLFTSGEYNNSQNNSGVNAFNGDGSALSLAVPTPEIDKTVSFRLDRQINETNTFVGRYEYNSTDVTNSGVGLLVLPSEGITSSTAVQTLQMGNTQVIGKNIVSETRFQYLRTRIDQTPNDRSPTIVVQGAFNGGGAPTQNNRDNQDRYEFQEYLSFAEGKHFIRAGARYRLLRENNLSTANYEGQFTFPTLAAYQAGTPSLFSLTAGKAQAIILTGDLGAYADDEWKVRKNVTLDYGLRIESQTGIPDHFDPAPRVATSWAVRQTDKHPALFVLRANGGIFYARFAAGNILTAARQNGVSQQAFLVNAPTFYPAVPQPSQLVGTAPTPYMLSPHLHASSEIIGGVTVERSLGKIGSVTANYLAVRGVHQYNSLNVNAPLPGTYDPAKPASGVRPIGGTGDVYQFSSGGIEKTQAFYMTANVQPTKKISIFGFYSARHQMSDTAGAASFPSQSYNPRADYGPSGLGFQAIGQRLFLGSTFKLPLGFSLDVFNAIASRSRFNITTGTDLNGDTQYNDRPAFATNPGPTSVLYQTSYGNFDANPQPGERVIPYNYARGPRVIFTYLGLSKDFKFGPRAPAEAGTPKGKAVKGEPRYDWSFEIDAPNIVNNVNPGPPVGVLSSPYFGRSISENNSFLPNSSANRILFLQTSFHF